MTTTSFKQGIQNELNVEGLSRGNKIVKVEDVHANTIMRFESAVDSETLKFLDNRFLSGVRLSSDDSIVVINTPNESNKK